MRESEGTVRSKMSLLRMFCLLCEGALILHERILVSCCECSCLYILGANVFDVGRITHCDQSCKWHRPFSAVPLASLPRAIYPCLDTAQPVGSSVPSFLYKDLAVNPSKNVATHDMPSKCLLSWNTVKGRSPLRRHVQSFGGWGVEGSKLYFEQGPQVTAVLNIRCARTMRSDLQLGAVGVTLLESVYPLLCLSSRFGRIPISGQQFEQQKPNMAEHTQESAPARHRRPGSSSLTSRLAAGCCEEGLMYFVSISMHWRILGSLSFCIHAFMDYI